MTSLLEATSLNTSFSFLSPGLQLAVDSTSLGAAKTCFRLYYYTIILGWQPKDLSPHLTFGLLVHSGRERYYHAKAKGQEHEEALRGVVAWVLEETWNKTLSRPWISDHPVKNRLTLLRTLVWYLDQYGPSDGLETVILASGKPAVELSFEFDSGYSTQDGEDIQLCGHLDRIARLAGTGQTYIDDTKTTQYTLSSSWFNKFTPNSQFSLYCIAGKVVWKEPIQGLIIDGVQVAAGFSRFGRELIPRPPEVLDEWMTATGKWLQMLEQCALDGQRAEAAGRDASEGWPMNEASCDKYGGCQFQPICGRAPKAREIWLQAGFRRRVWDPLQRRGDI